MKALKKKGGGGERERELQTKCQISWIWVFLSIFPVAETYGGKTSLTLLQLFNNAVKERLFWWCSGQRRQAPGNQGRERGQQRSMAGEREKIRKGVQSGQGEGKWTGRREVDRERESRQEEGKWTGRGGSGQGEGKWTGRREVDRERESGQGEGKWSRRMEVDRERGWTGWGEMDKSLKWIQSLIQNHIQYSAVRLLESRE